MTKIGIIIKNDKQKGDAAKPHLLSIIRFNLINEATSHFRILLFYRYHYRNQAIPVHQGM